MKIDITHRNSFESNHFTNQNVGNANSLIGNSSTGGSLTPKSPLKRQNPFNRTAPPVPSLAVNRLQQTQFMATDQQPLQQQNEPEQHHQQLNFNLGKP